ncbi:hypothetical protein L596_000563 [Steinernema carpocapsae]|uniref:Uncharacterized protein n=1 Tax=Steinernema carpocapsae TaxID=34508 RepID=A0A4U8UJC2_STECR|nr:hypothetical protein L596_000563 [Steinernema carpocapsae]
MCNPGSTGKRGPGCRFSKVRHSYPQVTLDVPLVTEELEVGLVWSCHARIYSHNLDMEVKERSILLISSTRKAS